MNRDVRVETEWEGTPVCRAIERFYRDLSMTLEEIPDSAGGGVIRVLQRDLEKEAYRICIRSHREMVVEAADELGVIYGLNRISSQYLGVHPFWFWNDQNFIKRAAATVPEGILESEAKPVEFRGWFINDEVLLSHWNGGKEEEYPWEMAFEALLRCGGNLIIPGTDKNSKKYGGLAADMGLWITQHHAEPLGAEMFSRAYPGLNPSFKEYPELFRGLWEDGILSRHSDKVIWNLGFRGQGDVPFWENDPLYDTPQKRGELIGSIIREQYDLVKRYVKEPVCCVNLYGETLELYRDGFLKLPEHIIMVWADNGYGKMVSRRQWNHNPRISALPAQEFHGDDHGVYYHVSFYDLQAANVLTMIPNSMEFVGRELTGAYNAGIRRLWLVNCSNIKPHVYPLDYIAALWNDLKTRPDDHLKEYLECYFTPVSQEVLTEMKQCVQGYFHAMLSYGSREDEHAGEQFYNYVTRVFIHYWMKDGGKKACKELEWCAPLDSFASQVKWFGRTCLNGAPHFRELLKRCEHMTGQTGTLWQDSVLLQVKLHTCCVEGVIKFAEGYEAFRIGEYQNAFRSLGDAADWFEKADAAMKDCGHGKWLGFYDNDCQTDIKETAYLLRLLMGFVRNMEDGPYFYRWQRDALYAPQDKKILLLLNEENHLTDSQLYETIKKKQDFFNRAEYVADCDSVTLFWDKPELADGTEKYQVLLDGHEAAVTDKTHITIEGLTENTEYTIKITADCGASKTMYVRTGEKKRLLDVTKEPYFAAGDGRSMDTDAIQRAINDCGKQDTVYIPAGVFLTGALRLHSDMELYLAEGALLQGTDAPEDYLPRIWSRFEGTELECYSGLLNLGELDRAGGFCCENVVIRGKGTIAGGGRILAERIIESERERIKDYLEKLGDKVLECENQDTIPGRVRPRLIQICNSRNIRISGVTLKNGASWNVHMIYSDRILTYDCMFHSENIWNGDGWDPDSSTNCTIFGCTFYTGDDAIAIKSGKNPEGNQINRPSRNIRIFDCRSMSGHGIAIGSEMSGGISNVEIWDCDLSESMYGVEIKGTGKRGGYVRDIRVRDCKAPGILIHSVPYNDDGKSAGVMPVFERCVFERLRLSGICLDENGIKKTCRPINLCGFSLPEHYLRNVVFRNIVLGSGECENEAQQISMQCCKSISFENISCGE